MKPYLLLYMLSVVRLMNAEETYIKCAMKRTSRLGFTARSVVNEMGQRILAVEGLGGARDTDVVGLSVEHWVARCDGLQVVMLQVNVTGPAETIETPAVTEVVTIPGITIEEKKFHQSGNTTAKISQIDVTETALLPNTADESRTTTAQAFTCSSGYKVVPGVGCYKESSSRLTWKEARRSCRADGAHLATPDTQQELDALRTIVISGRFYSHWVGVHRTSGEWRTVKGGPGRLAWAPNQPTGYGNCTLLTEAGLYDFPCDGEIYSFICEKRLV